ncbi:MAG: hypothetical protein A2X05_16225 [Bacteroidetes bacterium GWE2_41_25]|nr:MAG: hypothetical protein A2X03_12345 [Bacteroidetes bacterium GWA2_40_15]OFX90974.1 MAG: hypothetical protein A2X05_16225 [Bacteroidetes bacterium GWE2_41_25]OFY00246.1 MAG: hypothetical protein A2X06_16950 [Bacteroidetes bacterium GWC2_40_22]OFY59162.1 MAG: hypothetical protein A2X04_09730 [Bacteroidetes bacterium GWF2_41_9]HAM09370.1 hypothetical protein [Bacteroidales bacterium]
MTEQIDLPEELNISLGSESRDFTVRGRRAKPIGSSLFQIIFGIVWLGFISIFLSFFFDSFAQGGFNQVISEINDSNEGNSQQSGIFVVIFFSVFVSVGLFMLLGGVLSLFKRGGYFVGTPTRLVRFKKGKMMSSDWEQFNGNIEVRGNNNRGTITLEMRTGRMTSGKGGSRYVPDFVYISGVPGVYEIEQICRKRIKENDPTPLSGS